ncbi:MAG: pyridoxamine 5'-phosphate oxidase family protein [Pyrinomonadaceae bacterium]
MDTEQSHNEDVQKLREMIKGIEIGMLTTVDDDGTLRSRPMSTNGEVEFDGDLWFFTYGNSHKVFEVQHEPQVNVSFASDKSNQYVSMSGTARLVRDRQKIAELWKPQLKAWFPKGTDEPDIALLNVSVTKAEYWDSPGGMVAHAIGLVKALATGTTYAGG